MIIPIRCFTCGTILADKWEYFKNESEKREKKAEKGENVIMTDIEFFDKSVKGQILDELKLTKYCCRRHMLTHVDIL